MNNNDVNTEKLMRYVDGELSGSELSGFEKLVAENSSLQQELENLKLAKMAVRSYGLKNQVASVHRAVMNDFKLKQQPGAKIYLLVRSTLKYAASVILVVFAAGIYLYLSSSPAKLYNQNYQPYKLSVARGVSQGSELEKAFNSGDYNNVISQFTKLKGPGSKAYFLAGQAYLALHKPADAVHAFSRSLSPADSDHTFKDDAEYYLGLAYLENNQPASTLSIFENIHNNRDHLYHDKVSSWTLFKLRLLTLKTTGK